MSQVCMPIENVKSSYSVITKELMKGLFPIEDERTYLIVTS